MGHIDSLISTYENFDRFEEIHDKGSWFILRATYGRVDKAKEHIDQIASLHDMKLESYVPKMKVHERINGRIRKRIRPCLNNLFFCFGKENDVRAIATKQGEFNIPYINYYYDHFSPDAATPLTVSNHALWNFDSVISADSGQQMIVSKEVVHFKSDDVVKILDGPFKGVRGRVARVLGQQRVVVEMVDTLVATSYIPTPLLQKIEDDVS